MVITQRQGEMARRHPSFVPVQQYGRVMLGPLDGEIGCINGRRYVVR